MNNKRKSNNKKKGTSVLSPSITALAYKGPTRLPKATGANDTIVTQFNNVGQVATSAGGLVTTVFDAYAQVSVATDWNNFGNSFQEYRILSMEIEFLPWNTFNQNLASTTQLAPVYSVEDRVTATALGSAAIAAAYDSFKCVQPSKRFVRVIKMEGADEAGWTATGSSPASTSRLYIKLYSSGNANSINLYDFVTRIMVQFKGRQ